MFVNYYFICNFIFFLPFARRQQQRRSETIDQQTVHLLYVYRTVYVHLSDILFIKREDKKSTARSVAASDLWARSATARRLYDKSYNDRDAVTFYIVHGLAKTPHCCVSFSFLNGCVRALEHLDGAAR